MLEGYEGLDFLKLGHLAFHASENCSVWNRESHFLSGQFLKPVPHCIQGGVGDIDVAELRAVLEIEVLGFQAVVRAALPALRIEGGSIVAVSSAGLGRFPPGDALSVTPKAAVQALIRGIAREEGRFGVRANAVAVGVVQAGIFERIAWEQAWIDAAKKNIALRRFAEADEIASVVTFLASSASSYVTGQTLFADGGYSV